MEKSTIFIDEKIDDSEPFGGNQTPRRRNLHNRMQAKRGIRQPTAKQFRLKGDTFICSRHPSIGCCGSARSVVTICICIFQFGDTPKTKEALVVVNQGFPEGGQRPTLPLCAVPSALRGLTSVFGMGTGETPSLKPPKCLTWREERSASTTCVRNSVSLRAISTARLWHRCLYTCGLSTS